MKKFMNCLKMKKRVIEHPPLFPRYHFSIFLYTTTQNPILSRKLIYKHENSGQFPCLYHIPRFSTTFSVKPIHLSAKTANILLLFTFPFYTITETPRLLRESILLPDSTIFSPIAPLSAASKNPKIGAHHPP